MWNFVTSTWNGIKRVLTFVMPFQRESAFWPVLRWLVWILLIAVYLGVLVWLNEPLAGWVRPRGLPRELARVWLPILGVLLLLIAIVIYWLLLSPPADQSPFPDIDDAWAEAMEALRNANIRLPDMPLFLILGRPASREREKVLFEAPGVQLTVGQTPSGPDAPLSVFVDQNRAVYLTCRGASVLGKLSGILALEETEKLPPRTAGGDEPEENATVGPWNKGRVARVAAEPRSDNRVDQRRRRRELNEPLGPAFLSVAREVRLAKRRLAHLCRLICRDRLPHCPINGILLLVPLGGTDIHEYASQTATACQEDLSVLRQEMKLDCPVISTLVDVEDLPGFVELAQRKSRDIKGRIGGRFPMKPQVSRDRTLEEIERSLGYVTTSYLHGVIYPLFQAEPPPNPEQRADPDAILLTHLGNAKLVLLLDAMHDRSDKLIAIIKRALAPAGNDSLLRYAGCYLMGTGQKANERGFVKGVLQRLWDEQSCVSWTDEAFAEDAKDHVRAWWYLVCSIVLAVGWVGLLAYVVWALLRR